MLQALFAIVLLACTFLWLKYRKRPASNLPLPPSPPPLPLVGNMFDAPDLWDKPWLAYDKMAKRYGDIFHMEILGKHIIILASAKRVVDLFDKRSSIYSDRPTSTMVHELLNWDFNFGFLPYGNQWRAHRRLFWQHFNHTAVPKYQPVQVKECRAFLARLLNTPEDFLHHVHLTFASTLMSIVYDIQIKEDGTDPYISIAEEAVESLSQVGIFGSFLVDHIPILKYVPAWAGATFKKTAARWNEILDALIERPYAHVVQAMRTGVARPSLTTAMLEEMVEKDESMEQIVKNCAATVYVAGSDTTVSAVQSFFLAMALFPEVQKTAQAELDAVIGTNRLPDFNDRNSLPYIQAIAKETMRWQPVVPIGTPHCTTEDDVYDGYFIPKGSLVIGLSWTILHNSDVYRCSEEFRPERFLKDGQLDPTVQDPNVAAFGYGRRICPGRHWSDQALFINIASILSVFNISPPTDEFGSPIALIPEMTSGLLSHPTAFKCRIIPRSQAALNLIKESQFVE